jgi:flavin-binding protein dodecin
MAKTFKMITLVGTSPKSVEDAVNTALADASGSVRNLGWFEVKEVRGRIDGGKVAEFQVTVQVGFKVEND